MIKMKVIVEDYFLDLDVLLLGNKVELVCPPIRHIGYSSPAKTMYKLRPSIHEYYQEHNIYLRAKEIFDQSSAQLSNKANNSITWTSK
jgi:hypothetical protein